MREGIAFLARETGWSLEYIGNLSWGRFSELVAEISYQKAMDDYRLQYGFAALMALVTSALSKRHYRVEEFCGEVPKPPDRRRITVPKTIILADGQEHELAPLTLNMLCEAEEHFGKGLEEMFKPPVSLKVIRYILAKRLDMEEEKAGALVDMEALENMREMLA